MARQKKVVKYVPNVKFPARAMEYTILNEKEAYNNFYTCYDLYKKSREKYDFTHRPDYFAPWAERFQNNSTEDDPAKWKDLFGRWTVRSFYNTIWPETPEFEALNNKFMEEYNSREDLQEVYKEAFSSTYYFYDRHGNHHTRPDTGQKFKDVPDSYMMFRDVIGNCNEVRKKIEQSRETPYQEGDLVLLRDPYIGDRRRDPLYNNEWDMNTGTRKPTPGPEVQRIGTVISVTDKVDTWRPAKGSKIIQVIWNCKDNPTLENVQERYIKWHMRPTYKNGLKTKE